MTTHTHTHHYYNTDTLPHRVWEVQVVEGDNTNHPIGDWSVVSRKAVNVVWHNENIET